MKGPEALGAIMPVPVLGRSGSRFSCPHPFPHAVVLGLPSALGFEGPDRTPVSQFRWFQEVTLTRLQEMAENYNLSHSLHTKMDQLLQKQESLELVANGSRASSQEELHRLQAWVEKLERSGKKQALRIRALEEAWQETLQQQPRPQQESRLSNLTQEFKSHRQDFRHMAVQQWSLQKALESLQDALRSQGSKLGNIKRRLKSLKQKEALPSPWTAARRFGSEKAPEAVGGQSPTSKKLGARHRQQGGDLEALAKSRAALQRGSLLSQEASPLQVDPGPASSPEQQILEQPPPGPAKAPAEEKPPGRPRKPGTSRYRGEGVLMHECCEAP